MKKVSKKIKVLMVLPALNLCGGMESYVISYYRKLHKQVKFDFIVHEIIDDEYKNEIEKNGDKVYKLSSISSKKIIKNITEIKKFFKQNNNYDVIHCNMANAAFLYLKIAKKYNIKVRILHSHQNKYADNIFHSIRNMPLVLIGKKYANYRVACSNEAGDFLFKNKKYYIIKNAINSKKFEHDEIIRKEIRKELAINDDEFVIGNVGRLVPQKNQIFLIEILNQILKTRKKTKLIIIGEGPLEEELKEKVEKLHMKKNVIFIKSNNIVYKYMQCFDVFVLPSKYEGLGIVNIEAQASGLNCLISKNVPDEAKIFSNVEFLDINNKKEWIEDLINKPINYNRKIDEKMIIKRGYNIEYNADYLLQLYKKFIKNELNPKNI